MRRSRLFFVVLSALALVVLATPLSALADDADTKVVDAWLGLRMREGPSLVEDVLCALPNGTEVDVIGDSIWNEGIRWSPVEAKCDGCWEEGWVASAYLSSYPGYPEPYDHYEGDTGCKVTSSNGLRLRSGPGLGFSIERIVPYGTILEETGDSDVWADGYWWKELELNGDDVWAASNWLECFCCED